MKVQTDSAAMPARQPAQPLHPLLSTKLHIPRVRRATVARPRLFERLSTGAGGRITLVSAPAGYGKTTLVADWLGLGWQSQPKSRMEDGRSRIEKRLSQSSNEPRDDPRSILDPASLILHPRSSTAWLSLDAGDNDPVRFWRYVVTACQTFGSAIGRTALAELHAERPPSWELILTALINDLAELPTGCVLVLEDYHAITASRIHEQVGMLLDHLPPTLHLVLTTRSDPPLALARLRARPGFTELRAAELRFSEAETLAYFRQTYARALAPELIERLHRHTEGWITGLQLVAHTLQCRPNVDAHTTEQLVAALSAGQQHAVAYLSAEVLQAQPDYLQDFLLRTSSLSRLTGSLCDEVTGRSDSALILARLEQADLFVVPLDGTGQWFRYHALFGEALQREARKRLGDETVSRASREASRWYEQQGLLGEAVESALAAGEVPRVAELIQRATAPELGRNEYHTLRRWIECLPEAAVRAYPQLGLIYAMAALFTAGRDARDSPALLEARLWIAEQHFRDTQQPHRLGQALALRSLVLYRKQDRRQAFAVARQALALLPESEAQWRRISLDVVGMEELFAGKLAAARQAAGESYALWSAAGNHHAALAATLVLGDVCARQAQLYQAAQRFQQALTVAQLTPMGEQQALQRSGAAHLGLAALAYEWNDLQAAEQHAAHAVTAGRQTGFVDLSVRGSIVTARIRHLRGDTAAAQRALSELADQTQEPRSQLLHREVRAAQGRLALAAGDAALAERLVATLARDDHSSRLQQEHEVLLVARLRIAQGAPAEALSVLEPWRAEALLDGRVRSSFEIGVLASLAHVARRDLPAARASLIEVLAASRPEGFRRLYLDEGATMTSLLRAVWPVVRDQLLSSYVGVLLQACAQEQAASAAALAPDYAVPAEPLSAQERRVLLLLAAGLAYSEIAGELVVSINTIKTQVRSIYRKLNVNRRRDACVAARHLHLC